MTAIYFAGAESEEYTLTLIRNGVKHIMVSFYYLMELRREQKLVNIAKNNASVKFYLDSGFSTLHAKAIKAGNKKAVMPLWKFSQYYHTYAAEYAEHFTHIAELDWDGSGLESGDSRLRTVGEQLEHILCSDANYRVVPIWKPSRGAATWTKYCKDRRITSLGVSAQVKDEGLQRRMLAEARRYGKPVHAFGATKLSTSSISLPYDSVSSTTWLSAKKFGNIYSFDSGKFEIIYRQNLADWARGPQAERYLESIGCNPGKIRELDSKEMLKANIIAWRNLSNRMQALRKLNAAV